MPKINRQKWAERFKQIVTWCARIIWVIVFAYFVFAVVFSSIDRKQKPEEEKLGDIKVYNLQRERYADWDRGEAVQFGFEQLASSINYLFIAAAAIIGFISKIIIEPLVEAKGRVPLPPFALVLLRHTAWESFLSIFYGFFGYLYFNKLPDSKDFSIYEEIGQAQLCQLVSFLIAVFFLLLAVSLIVRNRIKTS
jgi:hypothetical protein